MAKIIYNNIIPFKGFKCINLFGYLFVRKGQTMSESDLNHEAIHTAQMKELLYVFFYVIYFCDWIAGLIVNYKDAYRSIAFEEEAYEHQDEPDYLKTRKHFAQWRG